MAIHRTDLLIVGSGLAGLALALKFSEFGRVTILTKELATDTNTSMAQGGIAAVMSSEDSFENHIRDTLSAGAGLCRLSTVQHIVEQAPDRIQDLLKWGVHFVLRTDDPSVVDLTREGGHGQRRILHFEDSTGAEIHRTLLRHVKNNPNIELLENHIGVDLLMSKQMDPRDMGPRTCRGIYALDKTSGEVHAWVAKATVLATGGAGKVYLYTSNWSGATGDGIAMAYRAGARVANMEFMQFHPTCLYHRESRNVLISEALRGEGGELIDHAGNAFMKKYHPMGSLAPRDVVARSIDAEMKKSAAACVFLDMTKLDPDYLRSRFPSIHAKCLEYGIDMTQQPIPVVPAAHYLCGGVLSDENGKTDLHGLWALGETACTGLHGANRLASNSLLEAMAMAHNASQDIRSRWNDLKMPEKDPDPWISPEQSDADEMVVIHHMWDEIRRLMWNYVGIVRSNKRLHRAQHRLKNILSEVKEYYSNFQVHSDIVELRNIAVVADLTVECALKRHESRGIHYNLDFPFADPEHEPPGAAQDTILGKEF
ncbi:MAG: L-aspartate oxidase [Bdellovibrionaceae bacterium]|nr:L-aspartate oxidase [Pseudobdellovibrionaceae bacterium]